MELVVINAANLRKETTLRVHKNKGVCTHTFSVSLREGKGKSQASHVTWGVSTSKSLNGYGAWWVMIGGAI